jgi:Rrf2 family nitric oxide-sensitive transcriptional repressor
MRLTVYTDYALRLLMYLAVHPEPKPTIGEVAASYGVSRNHLMKVAYQLGRDGYIDTVRGKGGGLRLGRPPGEIGLGELVRSTEPDFALVPCFEPVNGACALIPACRLRGVLHQAEAAFLTVLDSYTLADLVENRSVVERLLRRQTEDAASSAA